MLKTSGNIYVKPAIKDFKEKIEEIEQAELGTDTNGNPIAEYGTRFIRELAVKIGIDLGEQE